MKFSTTLAVSLLGFSQVATAFAIPYHLKRLFKRDGYTGSCTIAKFEFPYIMATCSTGKGGCVGSYFNVETCLKNRNGTIAQGEGLNLSATCHDFAVTGSSFTANCTNELGALIANNIDTDSFIFNDNGSLMCNKT